MNRYQLHIRISMSAQRAESTIMGLGGSLSLDYIVKIRAMGKSNNVFLD
jgi:hypothetical protein